MRASTRALSHTMKAARFVDTKSPLELVNIPVPQPGPRDVLVRVKACGMTSDVASLVKGTYSNDLPLKPNTISGLDAAGLVESVGDQVMNVRPGDRVYVDPYLTCGTCAACRRGEKKDCDASALRGFFAMTPAGEPVLERYPIGGYAEYTLAPDTNIVVLPSTIDFPTAARLGYLGTSYAGLKKARVGPGSTVLINGVTGNLGYAAVATALALGAVKILGVGRNLDRLEQIKSLSPNRIEICSSNNTKDILAWVAQHAPGGVDALFDCLGIGGKAESTVELIRTIRRGGEAVLAAGAVQGDIARSYAETMGHNVGVRGTMWFDSKEIDELVVLIGAGVVDLSFIEHRQSDLEHINDAVKAMEERVGGAVNVVITPGGSQ